MSRTFHVAGTLWQGTAPEPGGDYRMFDLVVLAAYEHQPRSGDLGVTVYHAPLDDNPWRPLTGRERAIAIDAAREAAWRLRAGQHVLVTCMMGLNRSGMISALALQMAYGATPDQAIHMVRAARGPDALSNPQMVRALIEGC